MHRPDEELHQLTIAESIERGEPDRGAGDATAPRGRPDPPVDLRPLAENGIEADAAVRRSRVIADSTALARSIEGEGGPKALEDKLKEDAKHKQMAELYRQHVLKEAPKPPVIQIQGLRKSQPSV